MVFTVANRTDLTHGKPFPPERIVENRQRLDIWAVIKRAGALNPRGNPGGHLIGAAGSRIRVDAAGQSRTILLVQDEPMPGCVRLWFECPRCRQRKRHVYLPEAECRTCLKLDHACRHGLQRLRVARIARLRRWLGVDERLFTPILSGRRRGLRYWQLIARIAAEEVTLLASMKRFSEAAEREQRWQFDQNPRASIEMPS